MNEINIPTHQLPARTLLSGKYEIISTIGEGGFGITYMGHNNVLDIPVAIKEYYPHGYANRSVAHDLTVTITDTTKNSYFSKWKEKFLNEAKAIAKFSNIPNIVKVLDFFEQNGTAYIVMEYLNGITLSDYISKNGVFDVGELCRIMIPMLRSLNKIHQEKLIHRDISPDNIMMMPDGSLKLYDFGAARDYSETAQKTLSVILKPGFAPEEQYRSHGIQGPWTDVYAVCATIYYCVTGVRPDASIDRVYSDELKRPSEFGIRIDSRIETALLMGMSIKSEDRFKNVEALATAFERALVVSEQTVPIKPAAKPLSKPQKANKKTDTQNEHTDTEIEILEDNIKKKVTFLDIMRKIAAKLNMKIIGGVTLGLFVFSIILMSTLVDKEMHRDDYTNYSKDEYSVPDISLDNSLLDEIASNLNSSTPDFKSIVDDYLSSKENAAADSLHGIWNGLTYTSDFFGIKCELSADWYIMADEKLASFYGMPDLSDESIQSAIRSRGSALLMGAINMENAGNFTIAVIDTNVTKQPTGDIYFKVGPENIKREIERQTTASVEVDVINVNFGGDNVRGIFALIEGDDITQYQIQVPIFKDNYICSIIFTANSRQDTEELIKVFSKL